MREANVLDDRIVSIKIHHSILCCVRVCFVLWNLEIFVNQVFWPDFENDEMFIIHQWSHMTSEIFFCLKINVNFCCYHWKFFGYPRILFFHHFVYSPPLMVRVMIDSHNQPTNEKISHTHHHHPSVVSTSWQQSQRSYIKKSCPHLLYTPQTHTHAQYLWFIIFSTIDNCKYNYNRHKKHISEWYICGNLHSQPKAISYFLCFFP